MDDKILKMCIETIKKVLKTDRVETNRKFDFIRGEKGNMLPVDAYFPEHNFVLEYRSELYFDESDMNSRKKGRIEQRKKEDSLKVEELKKHKIKVIYWNYNDEQTEEAVREKLKENGIK